MRTTVQPVKISEIQLLLEISQKTFYDTFQQYNTEENMNLFFKENLNRETLQNEMSDNLNTFFFARIENEIAGYLKLSYKNSPACFQAGEVIEIARLYATKDKIGLGIGKALMNFAISFAMQQGKKMIWLGVWEHNQRAINFYQQFGFKKFDEHIFYLGNDAQTDWLMKKELA